MGQLKVWFDEDWVRIDKDGNIVGVCGKKKGQKVPLRCLPRSKAEKLTQNERKKTAQKKLSKGQEGKQFVKNIKSAEYSRKKKVKSGGKICPEGYKWAMKRFGKWSAYAAAAASRFCKDENYAKDYKIEHGLL